MHLLAMSWKHVSKKTIENCFREGGFCKINNETSAFEELDCTAETNESISGDMPKDEFENWVDIDKDVEVVATMTWLKYVKKLLMMTPNYQKRVSVTYIQKKKFENLLQLMPRYKMPSSN